ncbi:MAG: type VI secretion system tip protein VgrG [Leptolyngbya sp. SIOISBB]|nr:type VI secretion system tip protein VgrG [Leptolyngbya sp. SIOISBB]
MTCLLPIERNTDVVSLTLEVDGTEVPSTVNILAVEVVRQVNRIPYARLQIGDGDPAVGDFVQSSGDLFVPGNELTIFAGYQGETEPLFTGVVLSQRVKVRQHRSQLEIICRDAAFKMTLTRHNRYFEEITDSDVAEALIAEYDLSADIAATEVTHPQLLQYQATDWDFLIDRLEANGQVAIVTDGTVASVMPTLDGEPDATIAYGASLLELDAQFDARSQSGTVRALAWDPAGQELQEAAATDPSWAGNGNLTAEDLSNAAEREEDLLWHGGSLAADALQSWADGKLLRSRLAASRGRARFQGFSLIQPGHLLDLAGISDRFNGVIYVTGVRHELSQNNWTTDAEFGLSRESHAEQFEGDHLPAAGLLPAVNGLQVGVVTQLADDPAGEHRIRVKIPVAGLDEQGVWARVASLDAGAERGMFFRPEVDDEVVLGFFHSDPTQPVVLGMLHSSAKAPPLEASEDNHQKTYVSRSGITLLFDDDQAVVSLATPGGNTLTLTDADGGIKLEDQNGNTLTMNSDGIELSSAQALSLSASTDLTGEGVNTEFTASAEFKAEGSASAAVSSSGMLSIEGALVQIN